MKVTFLGTGTSVGVPAIGCDCPVCRSSDPRNVRRRSSLYVQAAGLHVVVDTSIDFRDQALRFGVRRVDAVFVTHAHADHVFGLDDLRRFNTLQDEAIPVWGDADTLADLRRIFNYVTETGNRPGFYEPRIAFRELTGPVTLADGRVTVEPLPVIHGNKPTCGYRIDAEGKALGYVPDCHVLPDPALARLQGVDVMVLDALRHKPHRSHLTVDQSLALLDRIGAGRSFITHLCHDLDHEPTQACLGDKAEVPWDGLVVEW
jgi:phosphoribosyl 1,2-cyclic phosphate phosphodiesterase